MLGVYGQSIFIDPALRPVIVHTGAHDTADAGGIRLGWERDVF